MKKIIKIITQICLTGFRIVVLLTIFCTSYFFPVSVTVFFVFKYLNSFTVSLLKGVF